MVFALSQGVTAFLFLCSMKVVRFSDFQFVQENIPALWHLNVCCWKNTSQRHWSFNWSNAIQHQYITMALKDGWWLNQKQNSFWFLYIKCCFFFSDNTPLLFVHSDTISTEFYNEIPVFVLRLNINIASSCPLTEPSIISMSATTVAVHLGLHVLVTWCGSKEHLNSIPAGRSKDYQHLCYLLNCDAV